MYRSIERSTQSSLSAADVEKTTAGGLNSKMSAGGGAVVAPRRRTTIQSNQTSKLSSTSATNSRSTTGTSVATIVLEDEDDDSVIGRGSEDTSRPWVVVDDGAVAIANNELQSMYAKVCETLTDSLQLSLLRVCSYRSS